MTSASQTHLTTDHPGMSPLIARLWFWFRIEEPMVVYAGGLLFGIGVYFMLPVHPQWWHLTSLVTAALVLWYLARHSHALMLATVVVWMATGALIAHIHTQRADTPLLFQGKMPWATVRGEIVKIDYRDDGERLFVKSIAVVEGRGLGWMNGSGLQLRPQNQQADFAVGQIVEGRVQLFPVGPPPVPGSLDLQFRAYFQGVTAYAATRGPLRVVSDGAVDGPRGRIEALRAKIKDRMLAVLGQERGSVLVAMTVGFPRGIPDQQLEQLRGAGLAHLLAISGLHMTLVVGGVFWVLRLLMTLAQVTIAPGAWRVQPKKIAMLMAVAVGLGYFFLSGQAVPVQRAFMMSALFALAIVLDRRGISMRTLALAAIVVMLAAPQVVVGPSFQMSFAAVSVLILTSSLLPRRRMVGLWWQVPNYALGIAITSAIATVATATLTLFHFGQVSLVSVLANLVAVPIAAFIVMPAALIAIILMPLGIDAPFLGIAAFGLDLIQTVARVTSELPASNVIVANWPRAVPALLGVTLIVSMAMQSWRRLFALGPLGVMILLILWHRPADIVVTPELGIAVAGLSTNMPLVSPGVDDFQQSFIGEYWANEANEVDQVPWLSFVPNGLARLPTIDCTAQGCLVGEGDSVGTVALALTREAVAQACAGGHGVISTVFVPRDCRRPGGLTPFELSRNGPHVIWMRPDGTIHVQSDLDRRGVRPWTGRRAQN